MIAKDPSKETILNAIGLIAKDRRDIKTIIDVVLRKGNEIWDGPEVEKMIDKNLVEEVIRLSLQKSQ